MSVCLSVCLSVTYYYADVSSTTSTLYLKGKQIICFCYFIVRLLRMNTRTTTATTIITTTTSTATTSAEILQVLPFMH